MNKIFFPASLLLALILPSCGKHLDQPEEIEPLIVTASEPVVIQEDIPPEPEVISPDKTEQLDELNSLNKQATDLSSENDELKNELDRLTREFNELKQQLLNKLNKAKDSQ
ncbi:MAG: hypothetical protein OEZ15_04115 [Gammaproteobacteria bacterium]|nr:hypothetical protein [Gammaproteobacteria bacterium]